MTELGSTGSAGRGSGSRPSAAARRLAPPRAPGRARRRVENPIGVEPDEGRDDERVEAAVAEEELRAEREERAHQPFGQDPMDEAGVDLNSLLTELVTSVQVGLAQLRTLSPELLRRLPGWVRELADDPLPTLLGLAERFGVAWPSTLPETAEFARLRWTGDYAVDEFGFDPTFTEQLVLPLLRPLVQTWFRVDVRGIENIPDSGPALLVSNHAGTLPWDGLVLKTVVFDEVGRHIRELGADLIFTTAYSHDFARRIGVTYACQEDAARLLATDHLVAVFPEGFKGLGKPYTDRYRLQRFGRGGFVSTAIRAQVPIVPISIVGSEEIYPLMSTAPTLARALGLPYFPVTPLFPWFGVFGMIPLPSKWTIQIGEAITTDELDPGAADDPMTVFGVTNQVRETIQNTLYGMLGQRPSVFW